MNFRFIKLMMNCYRMPDIFNGGRIFFRLLCVVFVLVWFAASGIAQEDENESSVEAVKIFNQAQDAHEKGDLPTALKFYEAALKINPEFPEAEYQRGNALISLGKIAEAERAFRRAVELREDWTLPMASLGSILVSADQFADAEKILTKAIALDDKNFPAYVALTDLRLKSKAAPEVLRELLIKLQELTSKAKPTASLWASRAALERALGEKASAKMSLSRALAAEPTNKSALAENAEIALAEGDYASASEIAKILAQVSPNSSDVKFLQARVLAAEGETFEALKILNSITNRPAEVASLRNSIAAIGSVNVQELEKQIEKDSKNVVVLGRLCNLLRTENPPKALEYCRRASEAEPNNLNHAVGFGAALVQAKRFENAVALLRKIQGVAPDNYTARANLATALFQLKRFPEAKTEYQWLTEKQPDLPAAYYFLAIAHDNLGEYLDAMANYQQFLKLADATWDKLEIEKVNLRLPSLQKQVNKAIKSEK
jgi:tetratricopeptide (TPR) repeat protein